MAGTRDRGARSAEYFRRLVRERPIVGLCRAGAAATRLGETAAARHGLGLTPFLVLGMLAATGAASQQELSEGVRTDRTTMVGAVEGLVGSGLVTRHRNPADRRSYVVEITDAGRDRLAAIDAEVERLQAAHLAALSVAEREALVRILTALLFPEPPAGAQG